MLTEKLVSFIVRKQVKKYFRLQPAVAGKISLNRTPQAPLLLYLHIPFCEELCTYCSFHRVLFQESIAREYFAALRQEIYMYKQANYNFQAAYIGGGTPTILLDELAETIKLIRSVFAINEISVETNPNHLDREKMQILQAAGIERLSVGVQSFNDDILKSIGRYDKYGSGKDIIPKIRDLQGWFKTVNIDMIFNFPLQTEEMLKQDLVIIRDLKVDQVTFYPLMIAATTRNDMERKIGIVNNKRGKKYFEMITAELQKEYRASTAWCFSKNDALIDEYVVNYDEYAGIGSGAFGYLNGTVYANLFDIPEYINQVKQENFPVVAKREFNKKSIMLYEFLMQFFGQSLNLAYIRKKHGFWATLYLYPIIFFFLVVRGLKSTGEDGGYIVRKPYYGVIMMREFFTAVNNFRDYCRAKVNNML
ncbi:MAG: coproporphyrinogen oxidase [Firmicutes bacterium]|nr:coproporphyrinogen oxidase [Bacillota bacterium]